MAHAVLSSSSRGVQARARRTASAAAQRAPAHLALRAARPPSAQQPRGARLVAGAGKAIKVTGEQLEVEIQERDRPLVVDFFATWCGPCLLLAQELDKVAEQLGDQVKILKVDVDENPVLSSQLRIEGLPTLVFIPKDSGRPALRTEGLLPAAQIVDIINDLKGPA